MTFVYVQSQKPDCGALLYLRVLLLQHLAQRCNTTLLIHTLAKPVHARTHTYTPLLVYLSNHVPCLGGKKNPRKKNMSQRAWRGEAGGQKKIPRGMDTRSLLIPPPGIGAFLSVVSVEKKH